MRQYLREGRIKMIQFEYGGAFIDSRTLLKDVFEYLAELDYRLFKILPDRLLPVPRYDQHFENFLYQNWAAIRRGHPFSA
jgi:hypothetical protein